MDEPTHKDLIVSLNQSLEQTKKALNKRLEKRTELHNDLNTLPEEIERIEAEISALKNSAEQTEMAISSLTARFQNDGFDKFGIAPERQNVDFGLKG